MNEERAIIGCILIDNDCLIKCSEVLRPDMFADDFSANAYAESLALFDQGKQIDPISLSQRLESTVQDRQSVLEGIKECMASVPSTTILESLLGSLTSLYKARVIKQTFERISLMPKDIDKSMAEIGTILQELTENRKHNTFTMSELVDKYHDDYFKYREPTSYLNTGIEWFDDALGELEKGDVTIVAARPSVGKSALANQIGDALCSQGKRVGYFNLEMSDKQLLERFIAKRSGLSLTRIKRAANALGDERERFDGACENISKWDMTITIGSQTMSAIRNACMHQNYDVIIIDYLQLIEPDRRNANRAVEVGDISRAIKMLAMELQNHIIVLSQLNRVSERTETKEPTMADIRESGNIEQDASNICLLWNMTEDRTVKGIKYDKVRNGEAGVKKALSFEGALMEFTQLDCTFEEALENAKSQDKMQRQGKRETTPWD